jgi:hypothetical protein
MVFEALCYVMREKRTSLNSATFNLQTLQCGALYNSNKVFGSNIQVGQYDLFLVGCAALYHIAYGLSRVAKNEGNIRESLLRNTSIQATESKCRNAPQPLQEKIQRCARKVINLSIDKTLICRQEYFKFDC